jgi:hypothetical protein
MQTWDGPARGACEPWRGAARSPGHTDCSKWRKSSVARAERDEDNMDKPSCGTAIVGAAVAGLVFGSALGPKARAVQDVPAVPVAAASESAGAFGCERAGVERSRVPTVVPPAGPTDAQVNASGTSAAGGAGTVPGDTRGDPCAPAKRFGDLPRGAASAAATATTPTTLNRR